MNSDNPYQPPATPVETSLKSPDDIWAFVDPQSVPAGRGLSWLGEGFRFFRYNPGAWIAIAAIYFITMMASSMIPFATSILQPMLAGGLMLGLYAQDNGGSMELRYLFEGFNKRADKLATLGALLLGITVLVMILFFIVFFIGVLTIIALNESNSSTDVAVLVMLVIAIPIAFIVSVLFGAVAWFGPPLIILHKRPVSEALKLSLIALKRNIGAFIILTFFAMIMMILSVLTLYLGLLIVMPILFGATYASWKDIFTQAPPHN